MRGAVVRQAYHEQPVLQHQEAHHERGHPHRPLDSSLRWNDGRGGWDGSTGGNDGQGDARFLPPQERRGGVTRGPIAVAGGAGTLVGDGAPPSRMASVGRRPLGGAGNLEEGIRGSCLRRNDGRRSGVAHFGALWHTLGGTAARSTPARRVHRGGSRKTTAATGRPYKRSAGRMPDILCIRVGPERGCEVPASARAEARERRRPNPPRCLWIPAFAGMTEASRLSC